MRTLQLLIQYLLLLCLGSVYAMAQGSESLVDGSDIFDETLHPSRHIHAPSRRSLTQSEADAPTAAIPPGTDNDVGASARDSDLRGTTIRSPNTTNASDYGIFIWISVGIAAWFLYHGFKRNGHCRPREHSNNNMRYPTSEQLPVGGVLSVPGRGYWAPGGPGRQAVALVHLQEQRPSRSRRGGPHRTRSARDRVAAPKEMWRVGSNRWSVTPVDPNKKPEAQTVKLQKHDEAADFTATDPAAISGELRTVAVQPGTLNRAYSDVVVVLPVVEPDDDTCSHHGDNADNASERSVSEHSDSRSYTDSDSESESHPASGDLDYNALPSSPLSLRVTHAPEELSAQHAARAQHTFTPHNNALAESAPESPVATPPVATPHNETTAGDVSVAEKNTQSAQLSVSANVSERECVICCDAVADHVMVPCGHGGFCGRCAKDMCTGTAPPYTEEVGHVCPVCRAPVDYVAKVALDTPIGASCPVEIALEVDNNPPETPAPADNIRRAVPNARPPATAFALTDAAVVSSEQAIADYARMVVAMGLHDEAMHGPPRRQRRGSRGPPRHPRTFNSTLRDSANSSNFPRVSSGANHA